MEQKSLVEMLKDLDKKTVSSRELTEHYIRAIEARDDLLNAFITRDFENALTHADAIDAMRAKGSLVAGVPNLAGIPIAHKDIYCTKGVRTTAGSKILENFIAPYSSTVSSKLEDSGAIMLGKANMDEFAMGSSNENSYFGPARNPWDTQKIPGGSSGGSAVAVSAGLCAAATGTDTGGSIRQPAAMCGITGIKPTYGRVSRWGIIAYASSLDQAGPMTRSAEDAALMLRVMAGFDPKDSTSINAPVPDYQSSLNNSIEGTKIGLCKEYFSNGLDEDIAIAIDVAIKVLESKGAIISEVSLPTVKHAIPAYYVIAPAEASANLARYDGVRFGYRCKEPKDLADLYLRSRTEGFGTEVKQRILVGTFALSAGFYEAYYGKAQQIRRLIKNDFMQALSSVDVILGPTTPSTAFNIGEKSNDPVEMYLQDIYTVTSNLVGLPAASIPAGFSKGMPIGMQLIGNYLSEAKLLNIAHQFQLETDHHLKTPGVKV
jgi:aspartyl-tRNA(Asn)/glutamyl-tRNA(Gln) amidotransferase subunit A